MNTLSHEGIGYLIPEHLKRGSLIILSKTGKVFAVTQNKEPYAPYISQPHKDVDLTPSEQREQILKEAATRINAIIVYTVADHFTSGGNPSRFAHLR